MYSIKFTYNGELVPFEKLTKKDLYTDIIDWLYNNGYKFDGPLHKPFSRKVLSLDDIKNLIKTRTSYRLDHFHNISSSDNYILCNKFGTAQGFDDIFKMLENFGISKSSIKTKGLESEIKIQKIEPNLVQPLVGEDDSIIKFGPFSKSTQSKEEKSSQMAYKVNPFMQAICVLGSPAAGKSVTSLNVLENSDHESLLVIPTDLSTSMIAQFLFGKLKLNKLGRFLLEAYKNPDKLYTVVIDEFHKPLTIKRVNDELLQAISLQRYNETRFLVGDVADELFLEHLENIPGLLRKDYMFHGNIKIPSNFGFILISSKPNIVVDNGDIYDRVDIVYLERSDIGKINTISDLLSRKIHTIEDKKSFKQMIKSKEDE